MKGNTAVNKQQNTKLQDEARLAYMIAWRDKRIAALQDMIAEMEQADMIYAAYIAFLLERCYGKSGQIKISKASIREVCGKYTVRAEDAGDEFVIMLIEKGEAHGEQCSEVADV